MEVGARLYSMILQHALRSALSVERRVERMHIKKRFGQTVVIAGAVTAAMSLVLASPATAIVDGSVATGGWFNDSKPSINEFTAVGRYTVQSASDGKTLTTTCTATLVAPDRALTTKHCVDNRGTIRFGMLNKSRDSATATTRNVVNYQVAAKNDVALLYLDQPVTDIEPMKVFDPSVAGLLGKGKGVQVVGWGGVTHGGPLTDELRFADMRINSNTTAPRYNTPYVMSLDSIKGYPTYGDSGGPVISKSANGQSYVIGTFDVFTATFKGTWADRLEMASDIRDEVNSRIAYYRSQAPKPPVVANPNMAPIAAYSYSRVDGTPGKVALNAGASSDSDGSITKYEWLYKGAVVATGKTASYAFGTADRAPSVTLRVTDDKGATGSTVKTLSLPNRAPVIGRPNPADGTIVGTNRPVLSTTVTDPDGDAVGFAYRITGYVVDKSSGPVSGGWTVPASTLDPGTKYDWTVTVTDGQGGSASASRSLTVAMLPTAADVIATPSGKGYWQVASDGGVFTYGDAQFYGSVPGIPLHLTNIMGMARTPSGKGYWVVGSDGGVFSFGDAGFYGSLPGIGVRVGNIVDMVPTKTGRGYWLVGSDGGVFSFGDAQFFGSMGGQPLNRPVVGMAATASGNGYWLVAGDGGVFSFGDAPFYGSMGGQPLSYPVVDMDVTPDGGGYWMTAEDGGVFTFGNAQFYGSMGGKPLNGRVTGMAVTPTGRGYWLNACDGGVFTFGDAPFLGSNPTYMCRGTNQG